MSDTTPRLKWRATYTDGTVIVEEKNVTSYDHLDRSRLRVFELIERADNKVVVTLELEPIDRLIWRRMHELTPGKPECIVHLLGKQRTVAGENFQSLLVIYEKDLKMEGHNRFDPTHPYLRVKLRDYEKND